MKKATFFKILAVLVLASLYTVSCTKENPDVRLDPKLATTQVLSVGSFSATVVGFVIASGDGFTERGVCYNTQGAPTTADVKAIYTGEIETATYSVTLSDLNYVTKYYVRAYATGEGGTVYGEEFSFTTLPALPVVTTTAITEIKSSSASAGGNVTDGGGAEITARGIVYSTDPNPTTENVTTSDDTGDGEFESLLTGLKGSTTYYVRAYATNVAGTSYGPQLEFTTAAPVLATVLTLPVSNILGVSASGGGNITDDGGADITARGVAFSKNPNPVIAENATEDGTGMGEFDSQMEGLDGLTTYYVRAYAVNSVGVGYGEEVSFTTLVPVRLWYVPGDYLVASYPGSTYQNWNPANSPVVRSLEATPDLLEGYVYMANPTNQWKFTNQPNWDGTNYGFAGPGLLDTNPAAGNMNSPAGYYKLNANAAELTYTAVATVWGVIGSATPMEWNDETPLTYDPASMTWRGGMSLKTGEFKFRANHNWDFNYGSADFVNLVASGDNIPIDVEADYYFILDLSNPNTYTYSVNRWGLIGSATPGEWTTDQNLTWDPANNAFVLTVDLVPGAIKFRANDDWAVNLGGSPENLELNGSDIQVTEAGNYTIHLFLVGDGGYCTIVKN